MATKRTTSKRPVLTSAAGIPVGDNQNSLTAGPRGPLLVQDWQLFEKHAHFNRERIPERIVHAKGSGAYGTLTITKDITRYTKAKLFGNLGKKTECFLRFSTVAGERGAADAERDVRGFAIKFYTEEGNWDLVGNNTPVFFVRDPYKFPDFIRTQKRDPKSNLRNPTAMWDFWSLSPESLHQVTILFSDRGLPKNYRQMHGFGSHTYSLINGKDERFWVKFHFKSTQGIANVTNADAAHIVGDDRESHQRDLFECDRARRPSKMALLHADHARGRRGEDALQPLRPHQGLAARGLSAYRGRCPRVEPESGELLRRGRAGFVLAGERGARHRPQPG